MTIIKEIDGDLIIDGQEITGQETLKCFAPTGEKSFLIIETGVLSIKITNWEEQQRVIGYFWERARHPRQKATIQAFAKILEAGKVKISSNFLNSYFTTEDTLKNYQGQLDFINTTQDITKTKEDFAIIISKGFKGINLSYPENRVMKGIFSLAQKQDTNENRPFIALDNISELYEQILEKKVTKKLKDGYTFKDFSGAEITQVNGALDKLSKTPQQIIIKGRDGTDKKTKKPLYFFYMTEKPLINIEYLERKISEARVRNITEGELKETAQIKISVLPIFLRDYHKYYKLLPKDISKEVRKACPEIKKISEPIVNFIDFLHRQDNPEVRRNRGTLIKELKLDKWVKEGRRALLKKTLLACYDIAKRTGYLTDYEIDQKGKYELIDIFYLNVFKYEHLKPKKIKEAPKERLIYEPKA